MQLRNNKILILGGSSGIGKAIAKRFCDAGATVMITGRSAEKLQAAKDEIASPRLYCMVFDVANVDDHRQLFCETENILGGLNGFVNSAAIGSSALGRGYEPWDITSDGGDKYATL